jgi:hypothetical protein
MIYYYYLFTTTNRSHKGSGAPVGLTYINVVFYLIYRQFMLVAELQLLLSIYLFASLMACKVGPRI